MAKTSTARTYYVKANLDHLNELNSSMWLDVDRAAAFMGLCCGCTGAECPPGVPDAYLRAWRIGAGWRMEAEAFRATRKSGGEASARERKAKFGTAQPARPRPEHMVEPGTSSEHMVEGCRTPADHPWLLIDGLGQGMPQSTMEPVQTPPEPATRLDFPRPGKGQASPIGGFDDIDECETAWPDDQDPWKEDAS